MGYLRNYRERTDKNTDDNSTLYASNGVTYTNENEIVKGLEYLEKYKVMVSKMSAEHAGESVKNGKFGIFTKTNASFKTDGSVYSFLFFDWML